MQQEKRLKRITLLCCFPDIFSYGCSIFSSILIKSMSPVVSSSWYIIYKWLLIENFTNIAFKKLISYSLFHIYHYRPCFQILDRWTNPQRWATICISKKTAKCLVINSLGVVFGMLLEKQVPKFKTNLVAALSYLNCN